jgi:hypothetical protein
MLLVAGAVAFASTLIVESKAAYEGSPDGAGIFMQNDQDLRGINIPIVVRNAGTYPSALEAEFVAGARLDGFLQGVWFLNYYDSEDGTCKQGQPGGFGTIDGGGSNLMNVVVPSPSDPDAFLFSRNIITGGNLVAGDDGYPGGTPSMRINFTCPAGGPYGEFIIDTTCVNPAGHLLYILNAGIADPTLTFTAGTIDCTSNPCPSGSYPGAAGVIGTPLSVFPTGVSDPEADPVEFYLVSGPGAVDVNTGEWTYTPTCGDLPGFDVVVEITDKGQGGCPTVSFHVDVTPVPILPQCTDVTVHWGEAASQTITASGGCPPYTVSGGAPGTVDPVSGDWSYMTGCGDLGTAPATVTVQDAAGQSADCTFDLNVTNTVPTCADPPDITVPNDGLEYVVVLGPETDADGDVLSYVGSQGPSWGVIIGNEWRGTRDPGDDGQYTVCYDVTDGCERSDFF